MPLSASAAKMPWRPLGFRAWNSCVPVSLLGRPNDVIEKQSGVHRPIPPANSTTTTNQKLIAQIYLIFASQHLSIYQGSVTIEKRTTRILAHSFYHEATLSLAVRYLNSCQPTPNRPNLAAMKHRGARRDHLLPTNSRSNTRLRHIVFIQTTTVFEW